MKYEIDSLIRAERRAKRARHRRRDLMDLTLYWIAALCLTAAAVLWMMSLWRATI